MTLSIPMPEKINKPRKKRVTALNDMGIPLGEVKSYLESYAEFIDIAKFGIGSAFIEPLLAEKLELYQSFNIKVYFGGTLFEKAYQNNQVTEYIDFCKHHHLDFIEISCGSLDIPFEDRLSAVKQARSHLTPIAEVGSKDRDAIVSAKAWLQEIDIFLDQGVEYVILEGRNSASAGIYDSNGQLDLSLIEDITKQQPIDRLIFEAPKPTNQAQFINMFGPNVNLGNVNLRDIVVLEAQRNGLRYDTFHLNF